MGLARSGEGPAAERALGALQTRRAVEPDAWLRGELDDWISEERRDPAVWVWFRWGLRLARDLLK